ncbi:MAG: M14 family metallopeptidase, partial [Gammaproteobacteria bacterium]|nr:M14 family metallopeptidase [Gammaproteobacteria bacterium]
MSKFQSVPLALLCLWLSAAAQAESTASNFMLGPIEAGPGTTVSGYLEIPAGIDAATQIPISVIHGAHPGPTLALVAGTHGYEYPPITALQRLRGSLDPATLSGTIILVHVANPPSFLGRTIYTSPVDGKNLNRVYPGKADGTVSERIAYAITTQVIEHADYLVDMHGGDGNEALRPYIYMPVTGDEKLDAKVRGMALAFGLDHIVIDRGRLADPEVSVFTDQTALTRGIPAITTETGQMGSNDDYWVELAENGVLNLLRHLEMLQEEEVINQGVVWLEDYQVIRSPSN